MSQYNRGRGSMTRGGGGNRDMSNLPPLQNIVGMIDQIVIAQRGKSDPDKDYADIFLAHSIPELGIDAQFDENGAPLTKLRIMMPLPKGGAEGRRDLLGLTQKKAGGPAMTPGSLVVFEKAWKDSKTGELRAHYSRGGPTADDQQKALKNLYSNIFVCVLPERQYKQQDGTYMPAGHQEALIADQLGAQVVGNDDELVAAIETTVAQTAIGTAGFQLHARQVAPEGLSDEQAAEWAKDPMTRVSAFVVAKPKLVGEGDQKQWVPVTTDEILKKLWAGFPAVQKVWGQDGWLFEFIPMMAVNQAQTLVPSSKKNDKGKDNSRIYSIYDVVENGGIDVVDAGWTMSHIIVERMAEDSNVWYSTYQNPVSTRPQMYALPDIPTPNMPAYHLTAVQAEAARLGQNKKAYYDAINANKPAPEQDQDQGGPGPR